MLTLLVATVFGSRAATIGFEDYEIAPGETKTLTLSVTNGAISFIGLQSDIETHDDLTVTGIDFAPGFEYKDKYTLTSNLSNPNKATFMIFAKNIKDVPAEVSGPLLAVTVRFAQNAQPQTELIRVGNVKVSDESGNKVEDVESEEWTGSMVIPVSSINLTPSTWSGKVGESITLTAAVEPANATDNKVTWTSDNTSVATVDSNGKVTAVALGTTTITAKAGAKTATCTVTIVRTPVTSITLSSTSWSGEEGATLELKATVSPSNATNKAVTWSSNKEDVATVSPDGKVTAVKTGTAVITATAADGSGVKAECNVTVTAPKPTDVKVTEIKLSSTTWSGEEGQTMKLTATVGPDNATNKAINWSSNKAEVATVSADGTVTAVKAGTAVITATAADGSNVKAECTVTVTAKVIEVSTITLSATTWSGKVGDSTTLTAEVLPANATDKTVTWTSNAPAIASVDANGQVTAMSVGTATITAKAGTKTATCTVIVVPTPVTSITLSNTSWTGVEGETLDLTAAIQPTNATNKAINWSSSDNSVATVSQEGKVTAVKAGTAVITAEAADDSGVKAECKVTVTTKVIEVASITLAPSAWSGKVGESTTLTATVLPANATNKTVIWTSGNTSVATVDSNGKVTAVAIGTTTITAKSGTKTATCAVSVVATPVTAIKLSSTTWSGVEDDTFKLTATVEPANATNKAIKWSSNKAEVATVAADGTITAVKAGTAVITAEAADNSGVKAECTVTVKAKVIEVSTITLSATTWSGKVGEFTTLTATVLPDNATNKTVTWTSDNTSVATVDSNGKVTAVALGTTTITAKAGTKTATCTVTIVRTPVTSITLSSTSWSGEEGATLELKATVEPTNATDKTVKWSSDKEDVATVSPDGRVTAVKAGTAVITATASDGSGVKAECKVTVTTPKPTDIKVTAIKLSSTTWNGVEDETLKLTATVEPANATNKAINWSSNKAEVATVSADGTVTAVKAGTAVITATAADGSNVKAECTVTVKAKVVEVASITLTPSTWSGKVGEYITLTAAVLPANATDKTVTWTSNAPAIASVDATGKVTAMAVGTATITATAGGKIATCTVTVVPTLVTSITLSNTSWTGVEGETLDLTATVQPTNATNAAIKWSSSNPAVATVAENGTVTAVKVGTAVITAEAADDSGVKAECKVTVTAKVIEVSSITLAPSTWSGKVGESTTLTATVLPASATDKTVTWTSDNTSIATVDPNGKVTAVAIGKATITAKAGTKTATCTVTVVPTPVTSISLSSTSWSGEEGATLELKAIVEPTNATDKTVKWSSNKEDVATVSPDGKVTAVKAGTAIITATAADGSGVKAECNVTVTAPIPSEIKVTAIKLSSTTWSGVEDDTFKLTATVEPTNATIKTVNWSSDNAAVATVSADGTVTAVKAGTTVITATAADGSGVKAECNVTVKAKVIEVASITLAPSTWSGKVGESTTLTATVLPAEATDKTVTWTSSAPAIASVDSNGKVAALAVGTVMITATAGGKTATCEVTVVPTLVTSIRLSEREWTGEEGSSFKLSATVAPADASNKGINWSSSDTNVATVTTDGTVTAIKAGTAVITATAADGSGVKAECRVSVTAPVPDEIHATSITLSATEWSGKVEESVRLTATILPENATNKNVNWSSSNSNIATVDAQGNVTAVSVGKATITATTADGTDLKATCQVTVLPTKVESITLSEDSWKTTVGKTLQLTATVTPENATNTDVVWTSSDTKVATVDANGKVTARGVGNAVITATAADKSGVKAECKVTVDPVLVSSIDLSEHVWGGTVGETLKLTATVKPDNATNKGIVWATDNAAVATVDSEGNVKAIAVGEANITATAADGSGVQSECHVTVSANIVKASSISLSEIAWSGKAGESVQLKATVLPAETTNKGVKWTSSDMKIATVDTKGNVTAVAVGTATITATTADGSGLSATCSVTVLPTPVEGITLSASTWSGSVGATTRLTATVTPDNATNKGIVWTTSNPAVAAVDQDGNVTAIGVGNAVITATAADKSGVKAECKVTVDPILVSSIDLSEHVWGGTVGESLQLTATVKPDNATNKGIVWTTDNAAVATVDSEGNVKAIGVGEANITATAADGSGVQSECHVTVSANIVKASSISLSEIAWSGKAGESIQLKATVLPAETTNKGVKWTSSDASVATVDAKGNVTALSVGTALITATTADGSDLSASCRVTVIPTPVETITLSASTWSGTIGSSFRLSATVTPDDATNKDVVWSTSNAAVATVDSEGNVTAVNVGSATITATAADGSGVKAECKVTVRPILVKSIDLSEHVWGGTVGESLKLIATVTPENATNKEIDWSSSDPAVATVDSEGNVNAIAVGEAVITATAHDGSGAHSECHVTVSANIVKASSISLSETEWSGHAGESVQLKATVLPAETTNKGVKWTSSDTSVATVDAKGVVTAVAVGSATITATTADGTALSATCRVTVLPILVQSLYITPQSWSGEEGESFMIEATVMPDDATNQALTFESSDTGVATVDPDGLVVITGEGTCVILVSTTDGSDVTAECVITGLSGVATLFPDNEAVMDVYNQNGILLRHACEAEDLKTLQPGIYIIRSGQTVKKIYLRN